MAYRKNIHWTDLPTDRRRRLVVILGELIQRQLSLPQEASHDNGTHQVAG